MNDKEFEREVVALNKKAERVINDMEHEVLTYGVGDGMREWAELIIELCENYEHIKEVYKSSL
jgi:hypothetical protein